MTRMDEFTLAYFEAALWSSNDDNNEPLDANYGIEDFAPETSEQMIADCADFQKRFGHLIEDDESAEIEKHGRWELAGHDFWLTRSEHGAGFWDGGWPKHGDELTKAAHEYAEFDLYIGDDGLVYEPPSGAYGVREDTRANRLFMGVYPTGIVYADKSREKHGDYARCAFLSFSTLELRWDKDCPGDLRAEIERDAARIQSMRGQAYPIDASGNTVILGGRPGPREASRGHTPKATREESRRWWQRRPRPEDIDSKLIDNIADKVVDLRRKRRSTIEQAYDALPKRKPVWMQRYQEDGGDMIALASLIINRAKSMDRRRRR